MRGQPHAQHHQPRHHLAQPRHHRGDSRPTITVLGTGIDLRIRVDTSAKNSGTHKITIALP
ncbi:hypothetical protein FHR32_003449 [Streptosporangium album]|uniref:Uncharacterized protein n=1 Tax=Streptosporangium album TaxID=47479 RepID=A0A7W7RVR5_9ACTN|nr:hypothetical protein [Streptosporangium album]MBB4939144.1 hypothetical protein [Streptosporangium album]